MSRDGDNKESRDSIVARPRDNTVAQQVAQYSRFVSLMKIALPIAAGILLLLVIVLPQLRDDDARFRIGMDLIKGSQTDSLNMTNARYFGTDNKGEPYTVTANGVRQKNKDDRTVDLVVPKADITLNSGSALSATAGAGTYNRDQEKLDLSGGVTVTQNADNHLRTQNAIVMLKEGSASGTDPVDGEGPYGTMHAAGGFDLSDNGKIVHFHGPAKVTFNPKAKSEQKAGEPKAAEPKAPAGGKP